MNGPNDEPKRCHVCGKDVSCGGFARIRHGEEWMLLCRPECAMRYYDSLQPEPDPRARELAANQHPLRFLVNGELGS
jgi:hypothetical protein